jgi:hypothetical protein
VTDADPRPPQPRQPDGLAESGFGFVLIDALAAGWGVTTATTGKTVWIELDPGQPDRTSPPGSRPRRNPALALDTGSPNLTRSIPATAARTSVRRSGPAIRWGGVSTVRTHYNRAPGPRSLPSGLPLSQASVSDPGAVTGAARQKG